MLRNVRNLDLTLSCANSFCNPVVVDGEQLPVVRNAKILGLVISSTLQWNEHINEIIKKTNKHLYFVVEKVKDKNIVNFYCTCYQAHFGVLCTSLSSFASEIPIQQ